MFGLTFKTCVFWIVLSVVVSLVVGRSAIASVPVTVARSTSRARIADMLESNVKEATSMICSARGFAPGLEL